MIWQLAVPTPMRVSLIVKTSLVVDIFIHILWPYHCLPQCIIAMGDKRSVYRSFHESTCRMQVCWKLLRTYFAVSTPSQEGFLGGVV